MTMTERMQRLTALRQERAAKWDTAREFLDAKTHNDKMSEADAATYDAMEKELTDLGKDIARLERANEMEGVLNASGAPILGVPGNAKSAGTGTASAEYKEAFWNSVRNKNHTAAVQNALQVGTDSEGGYLVPDEFERQLIEALEEENVFRTLATVITTASGDRKIPIVSDKGEASWIDEEGTFPLSDDTFGQKSLGAYKLGTALKISTELLHDSAFDLEAYISKEFGRRLGAKEEEAFWVGDGKSKPTGIFDATGGAETGVTAASATITFDDMLELYYSLKSPYRKNATWAMNDATIKALRKVKDTTGQYIWQPSVVAGVPDMIMNRPYVTSSYIPALASGKTGIAFGDFRYYWIGDRQGVTFKRLDELFSMTGQVGFLASKRLDGKLILPEAVKLLAVK